ncbi:MAG TPA: hypothetical protein VMS37_05940 [Verrucomicrobiae bacterium]|nr:hypothetical protein [Verrucomicrobiae bacterium]
MRVDLLNQIVLRWDSDSDCSGLLASGGIDAVWFPSHQDRVAAACRAAGADTLDAQTIRLVGRDQTAPLPPGDFLAVKAGVWPGARASARNSDGSFSGGASQHAWIDANGYLVAWTKALFPGRAPLLAYLPDSDAGIAKGQVIPYDSLELALIDAWAAGGNYLLAPDAAYRDALLRGDPAAAAAWSQLGRTARWLKENHDLLRHPPLSTITVLVERGDTSAEIAALMFRQSASPELVSAERVPSPDPLRRPVVVAAGIHPPSPELGPLLLAHAGAGASLVVDGGGASSWWKVPGLRATRQFEDRAFYALGAGRILVYQDSIVDPGDFALDVLDLASARRPVRLWDASAVIAMVSRADPRSSLTLRLVNYGSPARGDIMAQVRGVYNSAVLLRPGEPSVTLRTCRRGENTDVLVPGFRRLALVVFT